MFLILNVSHLFLTVCFCSRRVTVSLTVSVSGGISVNGADQMYVTCTFNLLTCTARLHDQSTSVWMLEYEWADAPRRAYVGGAVRTVAADSHYDNKKTTLVGGGVGLVLGGIGFALAAPPAKVMALPMIPVVSVHTPLDCCANMNTHSPTANTAQSDCQYCTARLPMHKQCCRICESDQHL